MGAPNGYEHMRQFAVEAAVTDTDWNEMHAKFVIARSLLDTFIDGDNSDGVLHMVQWGTSMVELGEEIKAAYEEGKAMTSPCEKAPNRVNLVQWFALLELARAEVKESEEGAAMLSDRELARMAELDRIALMGTTDEQLLHTMITRHDSVQKEINTLHRRCGAMCGPGTTILI